MNERILVVDDDRAILDLISDTLTDQGMAVQTALSGEEALSLLSRERFQLIVLDIMMNGISGLEVCRRIRERLDCPILFLSAKSDVKDIVTGLGLGADDYLTKPFALDELCARIQAHLRRQARYAPAPEELSPRSAPQMPLQIGEIALDPEGRTVFRAGTPVALSTREFELLAYLMSRAGQTLSREQIFRDVWQTDYGDVGTVAIHIKNLRNKIDPEWAYIKTIWGSGYRFVTHSGYDEQTGGGQT